MNGEMHERIDVSGVGVRLRFAGHSDAGAVRAGNEDSFLAAAPLWVVADGMGGHANGELASQAAIAAFADARPGIRRSTSRARASAARRTSVKSQRGSMRT